MVLVDKIGRRGLLMKLGPIMVVGMTWCLIAFYCEFFLAAWLAFLRFEC